mgnify:CR=1 FL=1
MAYPKLFRRLVWGLFPFLAALAVWQEQKPLDFGQRDLVDRLRMELRDGVRIDRLWIDATPPVVFTEKVQLRVFARDKQWIAVVPGFRSTGANATEAVQQLLEADIGDRVLPLDDDTLQ